MPPSSTPEHRNKDSNEKFVFLDYIPPFGSYEHIPEQTHSVWSKLSGLFSSARKARRPFQNFPATAHVETLEKRALLSSTTSPSLEIHTGEGELETHIHDLEKQMETLVRELAANDTALTAAHKAVDSGRNALSARQATLDHADGLVAADLLKVAPVLEAASKTVQAKKVSDAADLQVKLGTDRLALDTDVMKLARTAYTTAVAERTHKNPLFTAAVVAQCKADYTAASAVVTADTKAVSTFRATATAARAALTSAQKVEAKARTKYARDLTTLATDQKNQETAMLLRDGADTFLKTSLTQESELQDAAAKIESDITRSTRDLADAKAEYSALAERNALATSLSIVVQAELQAEAEKIAYPKMFVTSVQRSDFVEFTVRYRTPLPSTTFSVKRAANAQNEYFDGPSLDTPVRDGEWKFTMGRGIPRSEELTIRMVNGETGKVVEEVYGWFNKDSLSGGINTAQTSFDIDEEGMLSENPIAPSLSVIRVQGNAVLLAIASPFDQTNIYSDTGGLLSSVELSHKGGTTFTPVTIYLDAGNWNGDYKIHMQERPGGKEIDTVNLHWDRDSKRASLIDSADTYTGPENTDGTFDAKLALNSIPLTIEDPDIARIQSSNLYQATDSFAGPLRLYISAERFLTDFFYADSSPYVKYRADHIEATIDAYWDRIGHTYSRDAARDTIHKEKAAVEKQHMDMLHDRENGARELIQSAVNIFLKILRGESDNFPLQDLDKRVTWWNERGQIWWLNQVGVSSFNRTHLLNAAKIIFNNQWQYLLQVNNDVLQLRTYEDRQREAGLAKNAEGQWNAVSPQEPELIAPGIDRNALVRAARIDWVMRNSPDSRIVAMHGDQRDVFVLTLSNFLSQNPTADTQSSIIVAMNLVDERTTDLLKNGGVRISGPTHSDQKEAADAIANVPQRTLYNEALSWYDNTPDSLHGTLSLRTDTIVGKMMMGAARKLWMEPTAEKRWEIAFTLQRLTDIPAKKFMDIYAAAVDTSIFSSNITKLLADAQYEVRLSPDTSSSPRFTAAHPDIPKSSNHVYDGSRDIRVRFDLLPFGQDFLYVQAIFNGNVVASSRSALFIDIPFSTFNQSMPSATITLRAGLSNGTTIEIESDAFVIAPDALFDKDFSKVLDSAPADKRSAVSGALKMDLSNLPAKNNLLLTFLEKKYFSTGELQFDVYNNTKGFELQSTQEHGGDQCKTWLYNIVNEETNGDTLLPPNATKSTWDLENNNEISTISSGIKGEFETKTIDCVSGDIVQVDYSGRQHTMVIGKVENTGIWFFDSNFGELQEYEMDPNDSTKFLLDVNGNKNLLQDDETVRYHFISYDTLNKNALEFSIYRL